jgi:hypothetical protein
MEVLGKLLSDPRSEEIIEIEAGIPETMATLSMGMAEALHALQNQGIGELVGEKKLEIADTNFEETDITMGRLNEMT